VLLDAQLWLAALSQPVEVLIAPSSRLYWQFCLSAVLFAALALWLQQPAARVRQLPGLVWGSLLAPANWWHRGTAVDVASLLGNALIRMALIAPLLGGHLAFAMVVAGGLQREFDTFSTPNWPWYVVATLYTAVYFVVEDLSRFSLHRLMHKIPLLWRFHRFHHSAKKLTPLTLYRVHPVEMSLYYTRGLLVFGAVNGVFIFVFGSRLTGWQLLGVDALGFAFNFFAANLRHSGVWMTFGPLERWLISPAQHQLHHSSAAAHRNKNFGTCLALWDRLSGSHMIARVRPSDLRFGLGHRAGDARDNLMPETR